MADRIPFDIIKKAGNGDTNAFREIVDEYQAFAYAVSYRFLGTLKMPKMWFRKFSSGFGKTLKTTSRK